MMRKKKIPFRHLPGSTGDFGSGNLQYIGSVMNMTVVVIIRMIIETNYPFIVNLYLVSFNAEECCFLLTY